MIRYSIFLLTISLLSFSALAQTQESEVINFKKVAHYVAEEEPFDTIIPSRRAVRSVLTDTEGNVYILDIMTFQIKSFAADGSFRWAAGREGRGPGDLSKPGFMFMGEDDNLYVIDNGTASLRVFDLDGNFLEQRLFPPDNIYQSYYGMALGDERIILSKSGRPQRYEAEFIILNTGEEELHIEDRYYLGQTPELSLPVGYYFFPPHRIVDDRLVVGNIARYGFQIHEIDGTPVRTLNTPKDVFYDVSKVDQEDMAMYSQVSGKANPPMRLNDTLLIRTAYWPEDPNGMFENVRSEQVDAIPKYKNAIDLLGNDFKLLHSLQTEGQHPSI